MTHRSWVGKNGELVSQPTLTVEEFARHRGRDSRLGQESRLPRLRGIGLHRALDGGCDSIEHGLDLDDAAIAQMLKQGTWYVPTISAYYTIGPPPIPRRTARPPAGFLARAVIQESAQGKRKDRLRNRHGRIPWTRAHRAGILPHVELGMPPMDAIQCATSRAATMLDMDGKIGVLAPGAFADVIAVSAIRSATSKALENVHSS